MTDHPLSDDIAQAFAHPEARAAALAGGNPPDRISLRDHVVAADIGAFQQERGQTQRLRFNMVVELRPQVGAATDDVDLILSYDTLTEAIAGELAAERLNLLETLAERIAARVLREPQAMRVFLRIEKLDRGPYVLGVEIVRTRDALAPVTPPPAAPHPTIALVPADPGPIGPILDRLAEWPEPVILTLLPPDLPRPPAATEAARLRIALLAIEQAAWALAATDTRLNVVATRTEIDWALKQGNPILWAPSKLVLDTPGAPASADPLTLALWLAEYLGAARLVLHAAITAPAICRVPLVRL